MRIKQISYGFTKNLGNFQSSRLDVVVERSENEELDNPDEMLELAVAFVKEAFSEKLDDNEQRLLIAHRHQVRAERSAFIESMR